MSEINEEQDQEAINERISELEKLIEEKYVDDKGFVNINDVNAALFHKLDEDVQAKGPFTGGGLDSGWRDSNNQLQPSDLVGRIFNAGILTEMRQSSDVVAPTMNALKANVASLEYEVKPKYGKDSEKCKIAAQGVDYVLRSMPYLSLEAFISSTWDDIASYGFSLWEMSMPTEGRNAFKFSLNRIAPWQVYEWNLNRNRTRLDSVRVDNGDGLVTIDAAKLCWFGNKTFEGNYWGLPMIRPVVAAYSAYKEDVKHYLSLRRLQKGVLIAQETGAGSNKQSWDAVKSWLRRYYQGQTLPILLNEGMSLDHLSVDQPGIDNYDNMMTYWDSKIRGALDDSLFNLGADGVGSLALGQEISNEAQRRVVNKIDQFLALINGETDLHSNLLEVITEIIGFDPYKYTPCIKVVDNTEGDTAETAMQLAGLIKDGVLSRADVGEENVYRMIEALGYSADHLREEEERVTLEGFLSLSEEEEQAIVSSMAEPKKYSHIDFSPPKGAREAAARSLDVRADKPASQRGMTATGIARARDLENGKTLSPKTVRRMLSFFQRHEVDKKGETWDEQGKGWQACNGWGGDAGFSWARKVVGQMDAADNKEKK